MPKQKLDTKSRKNSKFTPDNKKNDSQITNSQTHSRTLDPILSPTHSHSHNSNPIPKSKSNKFKNYIQNQIHKHIYKYKNNPEYQKVLHLLTIKFLLTFNFILIQTTKDTLIVSSSGAEIIPILKGGPVIITSVFFTWLYSKLSKKLPRDQLFTSVLGFFIAFYFIYATILMPFRDCLTPHKMGQALLNLVGEKRQFIAMAFINWIDVLFFIITELWSTMVLLVSFWGFANQISSIQEAKKFYGILPIAGHISLVIGGVLVAIISSKFLNLSFFVSTQILLGIFCIFTFIALAIFKKSYKKYAKPIKPTKSTKERSFIKSMQQIWLNKPLRIIATITICYGFSVNMIEMGWKAYMKEFFNDPKFYQATIGMTYSATGLSSLIFSIFFGRSIISKIGWYRASQLTPITAAITTIIFCAVFSINHIYSLSIAVIFIGALHNILLKTMKLSLFDPTREMIYIPLGEDEKTSGKAAIDVFCFRLGKSSSSWVQILLIEFIGFGSFLAAFDSAIIIVAVVLFGWIMSIKSLKNEKSFEGL